MNIWHLISVNISRIVKEFGKGGMKGSGCKGNKDNARGLYNRPHLHKDHKLGMVNNKLRDTRGVND